MIKNVNINNFLDMTQILRAFSKVFGETSAIVKMHMDGFYDPEELIFSMRHDANSLLIKHTGDMWIMEPTEFPEHYQEKIFGISTLMYEEGI